MWNSFLLGEHRAYLRRPVRHRLPVTFRASRSCLYRLDASSHFFVAEIAICPLIAAFEPHGHEVSFVDLFVAPFHLSPHTNHSIALRIRIYSQMRRVFADRCLLGYLHHQMSLCNPQFCGARKTIAANNGDRARVRPTFPSRVCGS
jgi:hypothetical protein